MDLVFNNLKINIVKVTVKATKAGAEFPSNDWKEGQEIQCHINLARDFKKRGLVEFEDPNGEEEIANLLEDEGANKTTKSKKK